MKVQYLSGNTIYTNPIKAHEASRLTHSQLELQLGHDLEAFNYKLKPKEGIEELENRLVQKTLSLNKPIRLFYSGGTDSHSVAVAYARAHIPIKYTMIQRDCFLDKYIDGREYTHFKIRKLTELLESFNLPAPDVEVIVSDKKFIDSYYADAKFFEKSSFYGTAAGFSMSDFGSLLRYSRFDAGHYLNIFGMEKPRLYEDGFGIYWQITDTMSMYGYNNEADCLWFYINDLVPELIAKQCWNVIDYCKTNFPKIPFNESSRLLQTTENYYHSWCLLLGRKTTLWQSAKSREFKPLSDSITYKSNPNYKHLNSYREENTLAWQNYNHLYEIIHDLFGKYRIEPITTKRFYLTGEA